MALQIIPSLNLMTLFVGVPGSSYDLLSPLTKSTSVCTRFAATAPSYQGMTSIELCHNATTV